MNLKKLLLLCCKTIITFSDFYWFWQRVNHFLIVFIHDRIMRFSGIHNSEKMISGKIILTNPEKITICDRSRLHENSFLKTRHGLSIGHYVHIGKNLNVFNANHNYRGLDTIQFDEKNLLEKFLPEDFVWIGSGVNFVHRVIIT